MLLEILSCDISQVSQVPDDSLALSNFHLPSPLSEKQVEKRTSLQDSTSSNSSFESKLVNCGCT